MNIPDNRDSPCNRSRGIRPETEEKYRQAIELYRSTRLSCAEICRISKVTVSGFQRYLSLYHRHLLLARYDITCDKEEACHIKLSQLRGQLPATRAKYKDAIEACGSLDYIPPVRAERYRPWQAVTHALSRNHRVAREGAQAFRLK